MRRFRHLIFAGLTAVAIGTAAAAVAGADAAQPGVPKAKPLDGKELFRTSCKVCHGPKAEAGEYTPMTLIQEQWDAFFTDTHVEVHGKVLAPGETGKMVTDVIDGPMLEAIRKFCVDHAADSEQPMTCG